MYYCMYSLFYREVNGNDKFTVSKLLTVLLYVLILFIRLFDKKYFLFYILLAIYKLLNICNGIN